MLKSLLLATLVAASSAPAQAETHRFEAALTGAAEAPPNASRAAGIVRALYNDATGELTWTLDYVGLSGPPVAAGFQGPANGAANPDLAIPITGELTPPLQGSATLTEPQATALLNGEMAFNIETAQKQGGEIRGLVRLAP